MQKSNITEISADEFIEQMSGKMVIINGLGCVVSKPKESLDFEEKLLKELEGEEEEEKEKQERKRNKIADGVRFQRCARSRGANNLIVHAHKLRQAYGCRLNPCFLTLTFTYASIFYEAKIHDAIYCQCVQKFFKELIRLKYAIDFFWVAERHTESERHQCGLSEFSVKGRLHFHSIVFFDGFCDVQLLNQIWLGILKRCSLVKFPTKNDVGQEYQPLDAEWLYKSNKRKTLDYLKILSYINKYVKKGDADVFYCRCWGWSRGLSSECGKQNVDFDMFLNDYSITKFKKFYKIEIEEEKEIKGFRRINESQIEEYEVTKSQYKHIIYVGQIDFKYINSNYLKYF